MNPVQTRRLGTRGNSKYHYYGIRLKSESKLKFSPDQVGGRPRWMAASVLLMVSQGMTETTILICIRSALPSRIFLLF